MSLRQPASRATAFFRAYGFVLALIGLSIFLVARNTGLYPMVFADEWSYSSNARLLPFAESIVPSWLYFALFRTTNACGTGFLECARLINVLLYVGAAPLLYLIARRVCDARVAAWIVVMALLAPINAHTAYFMPETMYFTGFCLFAWVALSLRGLHPVAYGLAGGAVLGLMSLVKVHGLFLLPALLAFMLYLGVAGERKPRWWLGTLAMMVAAVAAMVAVRMALGYALAGPAGLSLFGNFYGGHVSQNSGGLARLLALLPAALDSLKGHVLALALLLAMPVATLLLHASDKGLRSAAGADRRALQVFALLTLGAAMALTIMFTASLAAPGSPEGFRLHLRYYDFVFPLLLIVAAAALKDTAVEAPLPKRVLLALPLAGLVLYAWSSLMPQYSVGITDTPELAALTREPGAFRALAWLSVLVIAAWAWRARLGGKLFIFALLPLVLLVSGDNLNKMFRGSRMPNEWERAVQATVKHLGKEQAAGLVVAGNGGNLLRALFHIDSPRAQILDLEPGAPLRLEELSPRNPLLLVVGPHPLPAGVKPELQGDQFALIRVASDARTVARVELSDPLAGGVLTSTTGLWQPESWGSWSTGKTVTLNFAQPLPKSMTVRISANGFHSNFGKDFVMVVGGQRKTFQLAHKRQERNFEFETDGTVRSLTIEVPNPVSPKSLGQGSDERELGLALSNIEIGARPER